MDHHPGGFIDRDQIVVFVQNVDRDVLGCRGFSRLFGKDNSDALPGTDAKRTLDNLTVHRDLPSHYCLAKLRAAVPPKMLGQEKIHTLLFTTGLHQQLDRFTGA
jgi:hypothetical protein